MAAKETNNNGIIKLLSKIALYEKNSIYILFENKNTVLFVYFIFLLFNLQTCQIILPDPVHMCMHIAHTMHSINQLFAGIRSK